MLHLLGNVGYDEDNMSENSMDDHAFFRQTHLMCW